LREFGIPLYLDETSHVNVNNRPFWYCGMVNILRLGDCVIRTGWADDEVKQACARFDRAQAQLIGEGGGIISIYYHPCEFVHEQFWDGVNFSNGVNPLRSQWKEPPMKSPEAQEQAFRAFETFLDYIIARPGVRLVTAREISSLYPDRMYTRPLTRTDVQTIARAFRKEVSYVDLGARIASAGEGLLALCAAAQSPDGSIPGEVSLEFAYGPASAPQRFITEGKFPWSDFQQAAREMREIVRTTGQMPSIVWVAGQPVRPEDFAVTLAAALTAESRQGDIALQKGELAAGKYVADDRPGLWGWVIFPKGFNAPHMMELAKLQAWTIKPAVLRKAK
jgi:hypothetical protein